jgi:hypothetical protein
MVVFFTGRPYQMTRTYGSAGQRERHPTSAVRRDLHRDAPILLVDVTGTVLVGPSRVVTGRALRGHVQDTAPDCIGDAARRPRNSARLARV